MSSLSLANDIAASAGTKHLAHARCLATLKSRAARAAHSRRLRRRPRQHSGIDQGWAAHECQTPRQCRPRTRTGGRSCRCSDRERAALGRSPSSIPFPSAADASRQPNCDPGNKFHRPEKGLRPPGGVGERVTARRRFVISDWGHSDGERAKRIHGLP
jgi:hypothetical protein